MNQTTLLKNVTEAAPNKLFMWSGMALVILSAFAYLGISGFGVAAESTSPYAPVGTCVVGIGLMMFGTWLKKKSDIVAQQLELRKARRPKKEPTKGDDGFLPWVKPSLPITKTELAKLNYPYDEKRTKAELLAALTSKRMEFWVSEGTVSLYGDTYKLRDDDRTVIG